MRSIRKGLATTILGLSLLFLGTESLQAGLKAGDPLPTFAVSTPLGQTYSPKTFDASRVGVLYLFKPDQCQSCIKGLDQLKEVSAQFKDDMAILAIGRDADQKQLNQMAQGMGLSFPLAPGDKPLFSKLNASILPTTLLVGPDQQVLKVVHGSGNHVADMLTALAENQLNQKQPAKARKLFLRATKEGNRVVANSGTAYAHMKEGKLEDAQTAFAAMAGSSDQDSILRGKEGLAEVLFQQGKQDEALKLAEEVLVQSPNRVMANLVKGKVLFAKGQKEEAKTVLTLAAADDAQEDFAWQKAEANLALGNLQLQGKESRIALKSFQTASRTNPYFAEALSNQGVALKDMGQPEKAMEVFKKLQKVDPSDKLVHSLLRQAQEAIAQKADLEKRKYVNSLVKDLVKQFKENKWKKPKHADEWTSPPMAVSILGFQNNAQGTLMGRIGVESILQDELTRALQEEHIKVVDRAILDKLLEELKLGSSDLADPDTSLRLGRIMAARIITTGSLFENGNGGLATMRLVDTESTNIVLSSSEKTQGSTDPTALANAFAKAIKAALTEKYPKKGRIAMADGDTIIINLGKKHGVQEGEVFNVIGQGQPIELNGRVLGYRTAKLGSLKVTQVEDLMAYGQPVEKTGDWQQNQKIIQKD